MKVKLGIVAKGEMIMKVVFIFFVYLLLGCATLSSSEMVKGVGSHQELTFSEDHIVTAIDENGEIISRKKYTSSEAESSPQNPEFKISETPNENTENSVLPPPLCILLYAEPNKEQWEFLCQIKFPLHIHLAFLNPLTRETESLKKLKNLTTLQFLEVTGDSINDEILKDIQEISSLNRVRICGCNNLTNQGLLYLAGLKNLKNLEIVSCNNISNAGLNSFCQHQQLEHLYVEGCFRITHLALPRIVLIPNLKGLGLLLCTGEFIETDFEQLVHGKSLEILTLSPCNNLTRRTLDQILQELPDIKLLYFKHCSKFTEFDRREILKNFPNRMIEIE